MTQFTTTTTPPDTGLQARRNAEALADAAREAAQARAAAIMAAAAARASAVCDALARRVGDGFVPASGGAQASAGCSGPAAVQAVARHAYFKAERRGFVPGRETDDWLEAERELAAATALAGQGVGPHSAREAEAEGAEVRR